MARFRTVILPPGLIALQSVLSKIVMIDVSTTTVVSAPVTMSHALLVPSRLCQPTYVHELVALHQPRRQSPFHLIYVLRRFQYVLQAPLPPSSGSSYSPSSDSVFSQAGPICPRAAPPPATPPRASRSKLTALEEVILARPE